ncbi:MAG TPA: TOMM precursor leader peptide-binding protein, partial [Bradyrhizobium sp.]|uniref:TOMM precursor leader peptide-binding protein n=1 Tax=Bradyrhizobium sp. TaxID=376 RepID=UPI002D7FD06D
MKAKRKTASAKAKRKTAPAKSKGKSKTAPARRAAKDVAQFAPNFTVYVLPPDQVCLYSEDRKFFLHGELYCELATAIGKGGKSLQQLATEFGKRFPPEKVEQALKRLIERHYIVEASATSNTVQAAYWASLGLPPGMAEQNLANCRVRVEAIEVEGAKEFTKALADLGVQIVSGRGAADLTITLASDYLDDRLGALNNQRFSDGTVWLLAQPSGAFPLVGPVFNPGKGPCWTCLFDRMIRNREVKGFLDRVQAHAVSSSPLNRYPLGHGAIPFAALEIAKAIASGFRTDLNNHIISHDLLGSTTVRHYVAHRPQCPTCGSNELRNPSRKPVPIELGPGLKLTMTSGGFRSVSPRATVARFRKHVSPLTGVVKKLERIEADLPL